MSTTFGQVCHRASKLPTGAGVDRVVLEGIVNDRYRQVINSHPFARNEQREYILQTTAIYDTGTVEVTNGSTTVTGTGTTFTSAMTGRRFRVTGDSEWYVFTYVGATSGTLDRAYEGTTDTDATYRIFKSVYALPADLDVLQSIKILDTQDDLDQIDVEELDKIDPARVQSSTSPDTYCTFEDDSSTPPVPQIELWPYPTTSIGIPIRYLARIDAITATSTIFPQWLNIECLFAGVESDLCRLAGDYVGAEWNDKRFRGMLMDLIRRETTRQPAVAIQAHPRYRAHRAARYDDDLEWDRWFARNRP